MRGKLILAVLGVLFWGLMVADVQAFCVYNKTDVCIQAKQTSGGVTGREFSSGINPNKNACCNWQTKDCNTSGKRDGIVAFGVEVFYSAKNRLTICQDFPIQAGGWLTVEGNWDNHRCVGHSY